MVNGERYRNMLTNFSFPAMEEFCSEGMWFRQDGATCHTSGKSIQLLRTRFPGRILLTSDPKLLLKHGRMSSHSKRDILLQPLGVPLGSNGFSQDFRQEKPLV